MNDDGYRELTSDDLAERWTPTPLVDREMVRTRYVGPDGAALVLEHPRAVPPPAIELYAGEHLGMFRFTYQGPA